VRVEGADRVEMSKQQAAAAANWMVHIDAQKQCHHGGSTPCGNYGYVCSVWSSAAADLAASLQVGKKRHWGDYGITGDGGRNVFSWLSASRNWEGGHSRSMH
jgi:hypothetical protein